MLLVDRALTERHEQGKPTRVGIVGAGFMSQGLTNQVTHSAPGMRVMAVSNRRPQRALDVLRYSGFEDARLVDTESALNAELEAGRPAATEDALLIARSEHVDVVVDATGSVEFGAHVAIEALRHGEDGVLMNAEIDATIGPLLQVYARKYRVILSACEGDEPGVQMNLFRWAQRLECFHHLRAAATGRDQPPISPLSCGGFDGNC